MAQAQVSFCRESRECDLNISHFALIFYLCTQLYDYSYLHAKIDYNLLSLITLSIAAAVELWELFCLLMFPIFSKKKKKIM